jgi:hypothetical protein
MKNILIVFGIIMSVNAYAQKPLFSTVVYLSDSTKIESVLNAAKYYLRTTKIESITGDDNSGTAIISVKWVKSTSETIKEELSAAKAKISGAKEIIIAAEKARRLEFETKYGKVN